MKLEDMMPLGVKPLNVLGHWFDDGVEFRLGTFESGTCYALMRRSRPQAARFGKSDQVGSVKCDVLHDSVAAELARVARAPRSGRSDHYEELQQRRKGVERQLQAESRAAASVPDVLRAPIQAHLASRFEEWVAAWDGELKARIAMSERAGCEDVAVAAVAAELAMTTTYGPSSLKWRLAVLLGDSWRHEIDAPERVLRWAASAAGHSVGGVVPLASGVVDTIAVDGDRLG